MSSNAKMKEELQLLFRPLTKSRFKLGCECPTKLFYTKKSKIYGDNNDDDAFLKALADGGFQVGKLAQLEFSGGTEITAKDYETSLKETESLLTKPEVTIYEAAIQYENLFIRTDILKKTNDTIFLYEVKAKSYDQEEDSFYDKGQLKKNVKKVTSKWKPYLYDIAFQHYVVSKAFPNHKVIPYLVLTDKSKVATVEGLNQLFILKKDKNGHTTASVRPGISQKNIGSSILAQINVSEAVHLIQNNEDNGKNPPERLNNMSFTQWITFLAKSYLEDTKIKPILSSECKGCEFRIKAKDYPPTIKSGFDECWKEAANTKDQDLSRPRVFDLWNFRSTDKLFEEGTYYLDKLTEEDVTNKPDKKPGLAMGQRQWKQIELLVEKATDPYIEKDKLKAEMKRWKFPYHFIDFETTTVAIPFHKGMRPYETIAFQFSHHVMYEDGRVEHKGEYFNAEQGKFPNFDFVRALKKELENDDGTVFRYADHENTVLNQIIRQMNIADKEQIPDREELIAWIKTITHGPKNEKGDEYLWTGKRTMVDLLYVIKRFYLHPKMGGSNSLKVVLPVILNASAYLQEKYSQPQTSRNFKQPITWVQKDSDGNVIDPYKALPAVFQDYDQTLIDRVFLEDEINNGGAALVAYARMQFTEMSYEEREALRSALLKYCELDTLAMVMLVEYFKNL
ncbi:MAG: DUF2779 domain-containing protein [Proteobacteria bacterium]|nr:DUF2779 domain-containing protein [Pseudomonadota bacterium]